MEYVRLGNTGLNVSRVCLGSMTFGKQPNFGIPEEDSVAIIDKALDAGINFIDCADMYGGGLSEQILGRALKEKRDKVVLTTKFRLRTEDGPNGEGASRWRIMRQVEKSLKALQTDYIDLYMIHRPDANTPIDETLRAMDDLVRQGKVRYIGCSNFDAWRIMEALWTSEKMNLEHFVCNQVRYNLIDRSIEQEILPVCKKYGMLTMCAAPLAEGWLSGAWDTEEDAKRDARSALWDFSNPVNQRKMDIARKLKVIANEKGITTAQLSIAWLLHQGDLVMPIIGASNFEQLQSNLHALDVKFTQDELDRIEEISPSPFIDTTASMVNKIR